MKKIFILSTFLLLSDLSFGQSVTIAPDYLKVPVVTTLPPSPPSEKEGRVIFLNAAGENQLYVYDGNAWKKVSGLTPPLSLSSPTITPIVGISTFASAGGTGVQGETSVNNNGGGTGVYGVSKNTSPAGDNYGVYGENLSTNGFGYGIYGKHAGTGTAIYGDAPNGGTAIKGVATTGNAVEATSSIGIAVYGTSNGTIASGLFQNSGGGIGVWGTASNAGVGGVMEATGTGNGLNASAISGKAIDASNNSATNATGQFTNAGTGNVLSATATSGNAIHALANSGTALYGFSGTNNGLYAEVNGGTAAAARIVNNNGTGNAIDANNNSATNATLKLSNTNTNGNALEIDGQIKIPITSTNRAIFTHVTNASNITNDFTILTYPNAAATDFLIVTPIITSGPANGRNPHPIGLSWIGAWAIFNQDVAPMPVNITFNILVIKQ